MTGDTGLKDFKPILDGRGMRIGAEGSLCAGTRGAVRLGVDYHGVVGF